MADLAISDIAISKTRGSANLRVSIGLTRSSQPNFDASSATGLIGQFFSGTWRPTIATGNIGTLPLSSPSSYTQSISYSSIGDNYGFIAIGYFRPPTTGTYTFFTSSDDHSGVWIGDIASASSGRTVANATVNNGMDLGSGQSDTKRSGTIFLTAGIWYPIRIVHEEGGGGDNLTFSWSGPGIAETTGIFQYFKPPVNELGQGIFTYFIAGPANSLASQTTSQARERINFTTRLRERISAESGGTFNASDISSSGQLLVSNRLVAKSRGHATLGVSATVTNLHATARSSLRERLSFVNLRERLNAESQALERINFTTRLRERISAESGADFIGFTGETLISQVAKAKSSGVATLSLLIDTAGVELRLTALSSGRERINWAQSISEARDIITAQAISFARESIRFVSGQRLRASVTSSGTISLEVASQALRLTLNAESNTVQTLDFTRNIENTLTARVNATARLRSSTEVEVLVVNAITGGNARTGLSTAGITNERLYAVSHGSAQILVAPDLTFFIGWGVPI